MPLTRFAGKKNAGERYRGLERRSYVRLAFDQPLRFKTLHPVFLQEFQIGKAKNISQNGMLFKAVTPPERKAYILIETNRKTLEECIRVDQNLIVLNNRIVGKVMRTHLNLENGLFEIGICFLHPTERNAKEIEALLK